MQHVPQTASIPFTVNYSYGCIIDHSSAHNVVKKPDILLMFFPQANYA